MRVLEDTDAFVTSPIFYGADGEAAAAASTPTVTCTRDDGTVLTAPVVSAGSGTGAYQAKLLAATHTSRPDLLTLVWTGTVTGLGTLNFTQTVEVVGGQYLTVPDVRALPGLSDTSKFPVKRIREVVDEFEDIAERYCGKAFVRRYGRETVPGDGTTFVLLGKRPVRSLVAASSTDSAGTVTAFTTTNWRFDAAGTLWTDGDTLTGTWNGEPNLTFQYIYGEDRPPYSLVEAAKDYVRFHLLETRAGVGRDMLSVADPESGGTTRFSTPDWDAGRPTGLLEVDKTLNALGRAPVGIG